MPRTSSAYCPYCQLRVATLAYWDRKDNFARVSVRDFSAVLALVTCGLWLPMHIALAASMPRKCQVCGSRARRHAPRGHTTAHNPQTRSAFSRAVHTLTWAILLAALGFLAVVWLSVSGRVW